LVWGQADSRVLQLWWSWLRARWGWGWLCRVWLVEDPDFGCTVVKVLDFVIDQT
jgi:hypothetical protein